MTQRREDLIKKLLYISHHRGMKEADALIGGFADQYLTSLSYEELRAWEELLQENDNQLMDWLLDRKARPEGVYLGLLEKLYDYTKLRTW